MLFRNNALKDPRMVQPTRHGQTSQGFNMVNQTAQATEADMTTFEPGKGTRAVTADRANARKPCQRFLKRGNNPVVIQEDD